MENITLFLNTCLNNLDVYQLRLRAVALSLNTHYYIIPLDILNSFGYFLVNLNSGNLSLVLNHDILEETDEVIYIPEQIKIVHIINCNFTNKQNEKALIRCNDSTLILYHKDEFIIKSYQNNYKYLKYSDLLNNKSLYGDIVDTFFIDELPVLGKERKILKNVVNRISNINNLILLYNSYDLNELYIGCDFDLMFQFIEHDILKYMRKVNKWISDFNLKNVHIKILLHHNNQYYAYLLFNEIIKNKKSLLTSGLSYDIMSMSQKYGLNYRDDIIWFIDSIQEMESKLNMLYSNIVVEFII